MLIDLGIRHGQMYLSALFSPTREFPRPTDRGSLQLMVCVSLVSCHLCVPLPILGRLSLSEATSELRPARSDSGYTSGQLSNSQRCRLNYLGYRDATHLLSKTH